MASKSRLVMTIDPYNVREILTKERTKSHRHQMQMLFACATARPEVHHCLFFCCHVFANLVSALEGRGIDQTKAVVAVM